MFLSKKNNNNQYPYPLIVLLMSKPSIFYGLPSHFAGLLLVLKSKLTPSH